MNNNQLFVWTFLWDRKVYDEMKMNVWDDIEFFLCPMCRNNVDPKAIVCTNCTPNFILNVAEYNKMKDRLVTK